MSEIVANGTEIECVCSGDDTNYEAGSGPVCDKDKGGREVEVVYRLSCTWRITSPSLSHSLSLS